MSPTLFPLQAALIPTIKDFSVISINFKEEGLTVPTGTVIAISVKRFLCLNPRSRETMSPSLSILSAFLAGVVVTFSSEMFI
jgi:hypothetical protein